MFQNANRLYSEGALSQAEQIYRQILEINPDNADILNMLGLTAQQKGCHQEAVDFFYKALAILPQHLPLHFNLAVSLEATGKLREAVNAYQKAVSINPNLKEAFNNMAGIYEKLGKLEDAAQAYKTALKIDNHYIEAAVNLAYMEKNASLLSELQKQYSYSPLPFYYSARLNFCAGNLQQAEKDIIQANSFGNVYDIKLLAAHIALSLNKREHAAELFHQAVNLNPKSADALLNLGNIEQKEEYFTKALNLEPDNLQAHTGYAAFLSAEGRLIEALEEYRKAVIINPDMPEISSNLALLFKDRKEYEQALDLMFNALIKTPDNPDYSTNIAETLNLLQREKPEKAQEIAQKWLDSFPKDVFAKHTLAGFSNKQSGVESKYSEKYFDCFADNYDSTMQRIKYNILQKIKSLHLNFKGEILDMGCGTGLAAEAFKDGCNSFTGVDISQKMLEIAHKKDVYQCLIHDDIRHFLENNIINYNLILFLDVFDYVTNIEQIISLCKQTPLLFTIENCQKKIMDYQLTPTGRYQHNPEYIQQLLQKSGYANLETYPLVLREEDGKPVHGTLFYAF